MFGKLLELSLVLLGWESGCVLVVLNCREFDIEGTNEVTVY
jgi:hypothetical protein